MLVLKETDKPFYMVPGGKVEKDETDEQAAVREVMEEIGVVVTLAGPATEINEHSKSTGQLIRFKLFNGTITEEPDIKNLPGKTEKIMWIDSKHNGIEIGNLLRHILPLLQTKGLID